MSLLPDKVARLEGLRRMSATGRIESDSFSSSRPRSASQISTEANFFAKVDAQKPPSASELLGGFKTGALEFAACAQMGLFGAGKCVHGLNVVQEKMTPRPAGTYALTNARGWREIFSTSRYEEGARIAALRMQSAISSGRFAASDNVFDLVIDSFQKTGKFSAAEARNAAFTVMGVIANGGPNMIDRIREFERPEMSQLGQSLSYIANAMPTLDTLKAERGMPLFSLPKEVKASCDNSKSYHFWLSATLARDLVKKDGIDPKTAATATFIAQKAYQVARETGGSGRANGLAKTLSQQPFSPVTQVVRTDLAYSASGAFFGSLSASGKPSNINLDNALRSLVRDSDIQPSPTLPDAVQMVNDHKISAFQLWDSVYSPNSAFNSVKANNPL